MSNILNKETFHSSGLAFDRMEAAGDESRCETGKGGWICNLQELSVHDGPGLRVVVFLKGCPLRCGWCQNPENLAPVPEIEYHEILCLGCLHCEAICPVPTAIVEDKKQRIDRSKCIGCMACIDACIGKALCKVGEWISVNLLLQKIMRYRPFFDHSNHGGVTLSGGEPLFQPEFTLKFLESCREQGIHTAIETCGYTNYETLKGIAQNVDLLIYDIKHMDDSKHITGTGKSNSLILQNLRKLCEEQDIDICVHIPLVSGFNDDEENIIETAKFVSSLKKIGHVDLLPFNDLAVAKYRALGLDWEYKKMRRQSIDQLAKLRDIVHSCGLEVTIGGLW